MFQTILIVAFWINAVQVVLLMGTSDWTGSLFHLLSAGLCAIGFIELGKKGE